MAGRLAIQPDEARRELAMRELARRHVIDFQEYVSPWYKAAAHHRLAAEYLEQTLTYLVTKGESGVGRLLILEPPRHGKSEQVSRHFPAWMLGQLSRGKLQELRVILTSYGADLAQGNSRSVRELVKSDRYRAIFGDLGTVEQAVELSSDSRSVQSWELAAPLRGGVTAAGVGGGITGKGAHLLIVDDPFKNREEAESEARRAMVWDWWTSSAYTRLEDGAVVIGMLTRWHGDDWAGRLLRTMAIDPRADRWVVVSLPALAQAPSEVKDWDAYQTAKLMEGIWVEQGDALGRKAGQALWPAKYDEGDLERIRANIGAYDFEALYQQQPFLRLGNLFKRDWFPVAEEAPVENLVKRVRYWDKAGSVGGDYTVGVLLGITENETIYVEHVARGQWTPGEREAAILRTAQEDLRRPGPRVEIWHPQDPGSAGLDSAQATNRMLARAGIEAHFEPVTGDKVLRAGPWSTACEAGQVRVVRGGWNTDYIEEHVAFPKGKYDDQVDGSSGAFGKLAVDLEIGLGIL
jgi:predicted phage terminase large subunit-like protein